MHPILLALATTTALAQDAPAADDLALALAEFNAQAHTPLPPLSDGQLAALAEGEVVTQVHRRDDGSYLVIGMASADVPKERFWLATQDPHYKNDIAVEAALRRQAHETTWYHRIDIPAPFADRHWVIDVWDNLDLHEASGGTMWERPWQPTEGGMAAVRYRVEAQGFGGLDLDDLEAAVEVPVNEGALDYIDVPGGGSLFVYATSTATGGGIPERLVAPFMRMKMQGNVEDVRERALHAVPGHYRDAHPPVRGLDGAVLARFR